METFSRSLDFMKIDALLHEIKLFDVRGGSISIYFRTKIGTGLGMHFGDHLDLILTSFWSHFGDLGEDFGEGEVPL